jgi:RNA polymerase sigma factor (sigma-70 family)
MQSVDRLGTWYKLHAPAVFRRARRLLGSDAEAQEIVQDVFLSLHERPQQFSGKSSVTTFLYAVTTHACFIRLRNHKNRRRLMEERSEVGAQPLAGGSSPELTLLARRALSELPEDVASALVYYAIDGMSHEEIARVLDCSRRHVGDLLMRAADFTRQGAP